MTTVLRLLVLVPATAVALSGAVPGPDPAPETAALEAEFVRAVDAGDYARAKAIDRQLAGLEADRAPVPPAVVTPEPRVRPLGSQLYFPGEDIVIDTGTVRALAAATDPEGRIWVAAATPENRVRLYRSSDLGTTWEVPVEFTSSADVPALELVCAPGDSGFVYLFYLAWENAGDLWALRVPYDTGAPVVLPVAVGPDTITDFAVTTDRDDNYYIYCLYSSEAAAGRTGGFTRSLDFGQTWENPQEWWSCGDPHLTYSTGGSIQAVWRYTANDREIHHQLSRYYGRRRYWRWRTVVSDGDEYRCWDPVIAQADTQPESSAPVWVAYTRAARDTARQDIGWAVSTNGGSGWAEKDALGREFRDEWFPDIRAHFGATRGYVHLSYHAGSKEPVGKTGVYWQGVNLVLPRLWSEPVLVSDVRVNAACEAVRARVVCPGNTPRNRPGVVFAGYHPSFGDGLYFEGTWNESSGPTSKRQAAATTRLGRTATGFRLDVATEGYYTATVYDPAGRLVGRVFRGRLGPGSHTLDWTPTGAAGARFLLVTGPDGSRRLGFTVCR